DASKVALVHLVARLIAGGYELLDTQFITSHLARFGTIEIPRGEYMTRLRQAIARPAYWSAPSGSGSSPSLCVALGEATLAGPWAATTLGAAWPGKVVLQKIAQTS